MAQANPLFKEARDAEQFPDDFQDGRRLDFEQGQRGQDVALA